MASKEQLLRKQVEGNYNLQQHIGEGASGSVYTAIDSARRLVAIKAFEPQDVHKASAEATTHGLLEHPHIIPVYFVGIEDKPTTTELPYIVMKYANRGSLQRRLRNVGSQGLRPGEAVDIVSQTADGLQYAHRKDVIHRDIKPANILLHQQEPSENVQVLIADFGVALHAKRSDPEKTDDLFARGTLEYMAPEQILGNPEEASDQYALGVVTYEMLAGHTPFVALEADKRQEFFINAHLRTAPDALPSYSSMHTALDEVVGKALAKDPLHRYPSVGDFAEHLRDTFARQDAIDRRDTTILDLATPTTGARTAELTTRLDQRDFTTGDSDPLLIVLARSFDVSGRFRDLLAEGIDGFKHRLVRNSERQHEYQQTRLRNRAERLVRKGEYGEAIAVYEEIAEYFSFDPVFTFEYGNALTNAGGKENIDRAIGLFTESLESDPGLADHNEWLHIGLAMAFARDGQFLNARESWEKAADISPNNGEVAFLTSDKPDRVVKRLTHDAVKAIVKNGSYAYALELLDKALIISPEDAGLINHYRGLALFRSGHKQEGIKEMEQAGMLIPDNSRAHAHLAEVYEQEDDTIKAKAEYVQVLVHDATNRKARTKLAELVKGPTPGFGEAPVIERSTDRREIADLLVWHGSSEDVAAGVTLLEGLVRNDIIQTKGDTSHRNADLVVLLAEAYGRAGRYDDAKREYQNVAKIDPQHPEVSFLQGEDTTHDRAWEYHHNAHVKLLEQDYKNALLLYDKSIILGGEDKLIWSIQHRGAALLRSGYSSESITDLKRAAETIAESTWAYRDLGLAYSEVDDKDNAIRTLGSAYRLDTKNAEALGSLAKVIAITEDKDLDHIESLLDSFTFVHVLLGIGGTKNIERSFRIVEDLQATYVETEVPDDTVPALRAKVYARAGRFAEARISYEKALHNNPNNKDAQFILVEERERESKAWQIHDEALRSYHENYFLSALERYEQAVIIGGEKPMAWSVHDWGKTLVKLGHLEEARDALIKARDYLPEHTWTHSSLGIAYEKLREYAKARDLFVQALEIDADNDEAKDGLRESAKHL